MNLLQEIDDIGNIEKQEFKTAFKNWRKVIGDGELYRGMVNINRATAIQSIPNVYEMTVRKDRQPLTSSPFANKLLDNWLYDETGIKFRSQAIFTAKDSSTASGYGAVYIVIPKGEFHYCWSPYIRDAYFLLHEGEIGELLKTCLLSSRMYPLINPILKKIGDFYNVEEFIEAVESNSVDPEQIIEVVKQIPNVWSFDENIKQCPERNEIMIACDSYYMIRDTEYDAEILKNL